MNQTQQRYLVKRIEEVRRMLVKKAEKKYSIEPYTPSAEEKVALIRAGKVKAQGLAKLVSKIHFTESSYGAYSSVSYPWFSELFDFSKYDKKGYVDKKLPALLKTINTKAKTLTDELILGDSKEALKALNEFAKMKI